MTVPVNIWARMDARPWDSLVVGTFNGANIQMPSFVDSGEGPASGVYRTMESFVSGYGSPAWDATESNRRTINDAMRDAWGGVGSPTVDIDPETGRLRFTVTAGTISITASTNAVAFGLSTSSFPTPAALSYVAPYDFDRSVLRSETITFQPEAGGTVTSPKYGYEARIMHLIRANSLSTTSAIDRDDEALTGSLAYILNTALGDSFNRLRCHLDDEDRLVITWPSSITATAPVWSDAAFRTRMGIAGVDSLDEFTDVGGLARFRGARAVQGNYHAPEGLAERIYGSAETAGSGAYLFGPGAGGYEPASRETYRLVFNAESTRSAYHATRTVDLAQHLTKHVHPYIRAARPVGVVLGHDWREYLNPNDRTAELPGASLLHSLERCKASRRMQRAPNDKRLALSFSQNGVLQRVTLRLTDARD